MEITGERYYPQINSILRPFEPYISYEHWHRYQYAADFSFGKDVLDVASGEGYGSAHLATVAKSVIGVDLSTEAVKHAIEKYPRPNLNFLSGAADRIPLDDSAVDLVVSFETIEHLDSAAQAGFLREVQRVLRPGGVFLVSSPNRDTYTVDPRHRNPYHLKEFTISEFDNLLREQFSHVQLFAQRVYPASYIWDAIAFRQIASTDRPTKVFHIEIGADQAFRPAVPGNNEIAYLIAICTNDPGTPTAPNSALLDISQVAFHGIPGGEPQSTSLYIDLGRGFCAEDVIHQSTAYDSKFDIKFCLDPIRPIRAARWDPIETRHCRVVLNRICWENEEGHVSDLDLAKITSNGVRDVLGGIVFHTVDPMLFLPLAGRVRSIAIQGQCYIDDANTTICNQERAIAESNAKARRLEHECDQWKQAVQGVDQRIDELSRLLGRAQSDLTIDRDRWRDVCIDIATQMQALNFKMHTQQDLSTKLMDELDKERAAHAAAVAALAAITGSLRWKLSNGLRCAVYYIPNQLKHAVSRLT